MMTARIQQRILWSIVVAMVLILLGFTLYQRLDGSPNNQVTLSDRETAQLLRTLPEVEYSPASLSGWSAATDLPDLVGRSEVIVVARVDEELQPVMQEPLQTDAGTHGSGYRVLRVTPLQQVKGEVSQSFTIQQPSLPMVAMSTLSTIYAKNVFDVGGTGLGLLLGFSGAGGLLGALAVVFLGNIKHKAKANVATGVGMGVAAILLAITPVFPVALPVMVLYGFNSAVFLTLGNALLLQLTPSNMRGRVMGVRGMALAAHLPGALFVGGIAEGFGARGASVTIGVICIVMMVGVAALVPALMRSDGQSQEELAEAAGGELAAEPVRAH